MLRSIVSSLVFIGALLCLVQAAQEESQVSTNATAIGSKQNLFTYAGALLPKEWNVVTILNERAVIGFNNGSARSAMLSELDPKDQSFLLRLRNGTVNATPLAQATEKIKQWSSSVSSTVTKLSKSFKDQFDHLVNNNKTSTTSTTVSPIASLLD